MTERFVSAAEVMRTSLGAADHPFVVIPHPISSASSDALADAAATVAGRIAELLTGHEDRPSA